ncbi:tRNA dihydrouridine synthase [Anaeromicropila herbilytica]|uniref:tRNA-dihydrouridine synthase n=1 Tax=Anaeromicropila herbilytica TaxID=2785025 RepID=A0A7R7IBB3_9FIRM|nr:tRNA-dihydrouridine synthase family protein [Anaeromicropila herbilytica]BCN29362.1 tRNA-dihydrouridine synthase [Anaeromicropila herbilytica]
MRFYFAPLEGVTGYLYRNAHHAFFPNIDKYFAPFIVANQSDSFKTKEIKDILPENNEGICLIPQILTNNAKDFIHTSKRIRELGYEEINLNLGCPSGTVVSKYRGSGFLAKREELDHFLEEIFAASVTKISVKTRIGKDNPEEFYSLIEIFNKYAMEELIIHPRIQKDFYKNKPNRTIFKEALALSSNPVCYNGDIFTVGDYEEFRAECPSVDKVMLGRGLIGNPGLVDGILKHEKLNKELLKDFHDRIYEDYQKVLSGDRNVLFKMKEIWFYMSPIFTDYQKYAKKIKKSERSEDYLKAVTSLFSEQEILC